MNVARQWRGRDISLRWELKMSLVLTITFVIEIRNDTEKLNSMEAIILM